jgi:hypothetical protein
MTGGSRGGKAFVDSGLTTYGNPHSVMGACPVDSDDCDFLIEGKMVLDWVANSLVPTVNSNGCNPSCGPFLIHQTDAGTKPATAVMGIKILTSVANRFFFVEHRGRSTSGRAALITWSDVNDRSGGTGTYGRGGSVLTDCTPNSRSLNDAGCKPRTSMILDVGTASNPRRVAVVIGSVNNKKLQVYVSTNLQFKIPR